MKKNYKLALITGGSSGIGLALAKQLAGQGTDVCLLARNQKKLDTAKAEVAAHVINSQQTIKTLSCDITDFQNLKISLDIWMDQSGTPDLVINSAGITYPGYFQELDVEIFHQLMDVNYYGTLHVCKVIIPKYLERGSGTIVNISSQAAFAGIFGYTGYCASKFAVRGFSDALRSEMKPFGIQISIVYPPDTETPQLAFERPLQPAETRYINSTTKARSAEFVADSIIKNVRRGKYVIIPGFDGKVWYRIVGWLGNLAYPVVDSMVRKAQKQKNSAK